MSAAPSGQHRSYDEAAELVAEYEPIEAGGSA